MLSGEAREAGEAGEVSVFALNNSNSPPQYKAIPSPNTHPPLDSSVSKHGDTGLIFTMAQIASQEAQSGLCQHQAPPAREACGSSRLRA